MKKMMWGLLIGILLLALGAGVYFYWFYSQVYVGETMVKPDDEELAVTPTATPTPDPLGPKNILLLGYAGGEHAGGALTDTMILAQVRPRDNLAVLISIPRDLWVGLPIKGEETKNFKINAAYAVGNDDRGYPEKPQEFKGRGGGGRLAKSVVAQVTGLKVDYFAAVNFEGFKKMVEILGGVEVEVPYAFEDRFYPLQGEEDNLCGNSEEEIVALEATLSGQLLEQQFPCRYETLEFEKGLQVMDGETALKFVRSRHAEIGGGDFGRAWRQQVFLKALREKLLSLGTATKIFPLLTTVAQNLEMDIDLGTGLEFLRENPDLLEMRMETIALTTENVLEMKISEDGQSILLPKEGRWEEVGSFIEEEIKGLVDGEE